MIKGIEKFGAAFADALSRSQKQSNIFGTMDMESLYTAMRKNKNFVASANTLAINSRKKLGKLHRAFLRNVLALYTYAFIHHISKSPENLDQNTVRIETYRLLHSKNTEDRMQEVSCEPPAWLKTELPRIVLPDSVAYRASHSWVETGSLANAFTFYVDKESDSKVITGYVGFLKPNKRHGKTAQWRADKLEVGGSGQAPRPLLSLIYNSDVFKSNYKKLVEKLNNKLPAGELKAITLANKVDKHIRDLTFTGIESGTGG